MRHGRGDRDSDCMVETALTPVSWIWAAVTARRIAKGRPVDPGVPVICVGNLTLGGTGKTPVVREMARRLGGAVLSRGYGGSEAGPLRVDPDRHTSAEVGDEPLMLARTKAMSIVRSQPASAPHRLACSCRARGQ